MFSSIADYEIIKFCFLNLALIWLYNGIALSLELPGSLFEPFLKFWIKTLIQIGHTSLQLFTVCSLQTLQCWNVLWSKEKLHTKNAFLIQVYFILFSSEKLLQKITFNSFQYNKKIQQEYTAYILCKEEEYNLT